MISNHCPAKNKATKVCTKVMQASWLFSLIKGGRQMQQVFSALLWAVAGIMLVAATTASAHFGMVIVSDNMIMQDDPRTIHATLSFSHPMERVGMEMARPKVFRVAAHGTQENLLKALTPTKLFGQSAWQMRYDIKRPGVHVFYMEPEPYWEPAEDCFIIHYTKTVAAAFGDEDGWDNELGLKTEIVPLSRPFGLYAGNVFQGIVKLDGKPVSGAAVEIEYYNADGKAVAPTDFMVAQVTKADSQGVFTYAAPAPGWWGFAALNKADYTMKHDGEDKEVELGAVIWVHFEKWGK
jgi:cobalt/nickel transport protein